MTTIQAHEVWELSIDKVLEICRILNLEKVKGQYEMRRMNFQNAILIDLKTRETNTRSC